MLFGKNPGQFFDGHYEVKCGALPDDRSYDFFTANREYAGNLFSIFENTYSFVTDRLEKSYAKGEKSGKAAWDPSPRIGRKPASPPPFQTRQQADRLNFFLGRPCRNLVLRHPQNH